MSKFLHDHDAAVANDRAITIPRHFSQAKIDLFKLFKHKRGNTVDPDEAAHHGCLL